MKHAPTGVGRARTTRAIVAVTVAAGLFAATAGIAGADRRAGANRYDTAVQIVGYLFHEDAYAVVASGESFTDALTANFIAGQIQGGVMYLTQTAELPPATQNILDDAGSEHADNAPYTGQLFVVEGGDDISDSTIASINTAYNRLRPSDRQDSARVIRGSDAATTAAAVATYPGMTVGSVSGLGRVAVVATSQNYPDALAASAVVYARRFPLLYVTSNNVPAATTQALEQLNIDTVLIMGGTAAVSDQVASTLGTGGRDVVRIAGATRFATATKLADYAIANFGFVNTQFGVARGDAFPDALVGGVHAGDEDMPILLVGAPGQPLPDATRQWLQVNCPALNDLTIYGGQAAVTDETEDELQDYLYC